MYDKYWFIKFQYPIGTLDELHSVAKDDGSDAEDVSSVREEVSNSTHYDSSMHQSFSIQ